MKPLPEGQLGRPAGQPLEERLARARRIGQWLEAFASELGPAEVKRAGEDLILACDGQPPAGMLAGLERPN